MEFPEREAEIAALALLIAQGLEKYPEDFPSPPVSAADLRGKLDRFNTVLADAVAGEKRLRELHAAKDQAQVELTADMKANLRYGEVAVRTGPEKLAGLGWGARRGSSDREPPGEVRDIAIRSEGDTWVVLGWKAPVDGGPAAAYKVQRRKQGGSWEDVATAVETECLLSNQLRGVEFDLRVVGVNKAGTGQPSATVTVVL
jgi:hypothetical protein